MLPEIFTLDRFDLPTKLLNIFSFAKLVLLKITIVNIVILETQDSENGRSD